MVKIVRKVALLLGRSSKTSRLRHRISDRTGNLSSQLTNWKNDARQTRVGKNLGIRQARP